MADGQYRFQQGAGQYYYQQHTQQNHHTRHLQQRPGSPSASRVGFHQDTESPSRSPGPQSPAHNQYSMYNQTHGQHVFQNGTNNQSRFMQMNLQKPFQHQTHQHHGHQHQQQQEHNTHGTHGANFSSHQHNISGGGLSATTPHFSSAHLQNGTPGSSHSQLAKPISEHWTAQLQYAQRARDMVLQHPHARTDHRTSKNINSVVNNGLPKETGKEERNRAAHTAASESESGQVWKQLDMAGCNLRSISPTLFQYTFLTKLYFTNNKIAHIPAAIGRLRSLVCLDLSINQIRHLPEEIGMLVNLRELLLVDNLVESLPCEVGTLYQLEMLAIEGNPLNEELRSIIQEHGTHELVKYLREQTPEPEPPAERDWVVLVDDQETSPQDKFSVLNYNTLCDKYCTQSQYGYTPSVALDWNRRRSIILEEVRHHNADFVALQEIDAESFHNFFREALAHNDYKGVFWPKSRAKTMAERDAKWVDGCATFYKNSKYILLDKVMLDFANIAINRPDMKGEHDIFNRVMPKDNLAVVAFFENRMTGSRIIVVNAHIHWDPAFADVKIVQVAILMEHVKSLSERWAKMGPCKDKQLFKFTNGDREDGLEEEEPQEQPAPSMEYPNGPSIPLIMCGDFNSLPASAVYNLITQGTLENSHPDLNNRRYGNFTRDGMSHPFNLKSSYSHIGELTFTNYTPTFSGVIDYIWYSTPSLQVTGLLGNVDKTYLQRVPGFPNFHFPSDHLALLAEYALKARKEKKVVEADFGPSSRDRDGGRDGSRRQSQL